MENNFNVSIMMNDIDNNNYYTTSIFVSSTIKSFSNISDVSKLSIIENFYEYKNKSTNNLNLDGVKFIKIINNSNNKKWKVISYRNGYLYACKSNGTTAYTTSIGINFTLTTNSGFEPAIYTDKRGHYHGMCFNSGYSGSIVFDLLPPEYFLGIACIASGGNSSIIKDDFLKELYTPQTWSNYYYNGGGGGGIYSSPDIQKDNTKLNLNISYNIEVKNNSIFGNITTFKGGDGSSTNYDLGGIGGNSNIMTVNNHNGGNGGGSQSKSSGKNSECTSITLKYLNDAIIYCGGGGGGGQNIPEVNYNYKDIYGNNRTGVIQKKSYYLANGGQGYGGKTYNADTTKGINNDGNGYMASNGGLYGGGGGGGGGGENSGFSSGGEGVIFFYWYD